MKNENIFAEMTADEFRNIDFEYQNQLVINCLIHSAKNLDKRMKNASEQDKADGYEKAFVNGMKESALSLINGQEKDDIIQTTWLYALERADSENAFEIPLLYMLSVCASKAISEYLYGTIKRNNNGEIDTENTLCVYFDKTEEKAVAECFKTELLQYIPNGIRVNCLLTMNYQDMGFSNAEIAKLLKVSHKTVCQYVSAIYNAMAMDKAIGKDTETALRIVHTVKAMQNTQANKQAEKAITNALKDTNGYNHVTYPKYSYLVIRWFNMSTIEQMQFITACPSAFAKIRAEIESK